MSMNLLKKYKKIYSIFVSKFLKMCQKIKHLFSRRLREDRRKRGRAHNRSRENHLAKETEKTWRKLGRNLKILKDLKTCLFI